MTYAGWNYVGAEGQSYPEIAAREVALVSAQNPSPIYGYLRMGAQQKIYLFPEIEQARGWFTVLLHAQQPYDYAAVFAATDLTRPVTGLESFGHTHVSGDTNVGNLWPFFLGLPLGGLGGYFLRRWQEPAGAREQVVPFREVVRPFLPGPSAPKAPAPKTSGDPYVGAPWLDIAGQDYGYAPAVGGPWLDMIGQDYSGYDDGGYAVGGPWLDIAGPAVGGPWLDMIGQDYSGYDDGGYAVGGPWLDMVGPWVGADDESRRAWPQTKALIQSAIDDVTREAASHPAAAYVWVLTPSDVAPYGGRALGSVVTLEGTTNIVPFTSPGLALDYLREVAQTRPVALAMFDRTSSHWPNPVSWRKSDDPEHGSVIAQHVASRSPAHTSGDYVGDEYVGDEYVGDEYIGDEYIGDEYVGDESAPRARGHGRLSRIIQQHADFWVRQPGTGSGQGANWYKTRWMPFYNAWLSQHSQHSPHSQHTPGRKNVRKQTVNELITLRQEAAGLGISVPTLGTSRLEAAIQQGTRLEGDYVGAWDTAIGSALDDVRGRARTLAEKRVGNVIGVIHMSKDGLWHTLAFRSADDADDWLGTSTHDPASYTYAAYFDKGDYSWPHPVNEKIGGARMPSRPGSPVAREIAVTRGDVGGGDAIGEAIGAVIDDVRSHAKALATARPGNAVGVIHSVGGLWSALPFGSLDDAIDWLQRSTHDKASFTYAAAFDKGSDGTAYFQAEEISGARSPSQPSQPGAPMSREIATTLGEWWAP